MTWARRPLGEVCKIDWGNTSLTKSSYVTDGKFLAVSAAGPDGRINHAEHRAGIPVISAIGSVGNVHWPTEDFTAIKNTITFTPFPAVATSKYLYYFLCASNLPVRGTSQLFISKGDLEKFEIPLPPLDEQKRIVAKLDQATGFIEQMKSQHVTRVDETQRLAMSILTGLIPPTKDSSSIMDVCDFKGGAQPPKSTFISTQQSGYVRFIQIRDFESDAHVVYIPESKKNRTCLESDVLIGRYGASVGRICRGLAGAYNVALMKVVPDIDKVTTDFLEIFLNSDFFQRPLLELSVRSAQSGFNKEDLATIRFPNISLDEQAVLVERYWAIKALVSDLMRLSRQKSSAFTDLHSSMLSAAFAGEV